MPPTITYDETAGSPPSRVTSHTMTLPHNSQTLRYYRHTPDGYDGSAPFPWLVYVPGIGSGALGKSMYTDGATSPSGVYNTLLDAGAITNEFLMFCPHPGHESNADTSMTAGNWCPGSDAFSGNTAWASVSRKFTAFGEFLDHILATYNLRTDRYGAGLLGFSMGAQNVERYACLMPERFGFGFCCSASLSQTYQSGGNNDTYEVWIGLPPHPAGAEAFFDANKTAGLWASEAAAVQAAGGLDLWITYGASGDDSTRTDHADSWTACRAAGFRPQETTGLVGVGHSMSQTLGAIGGAPFLAFDRFLSRQTGTFGI